MKPLWVAKVVGFNVILLAAAYEVLADLSWRAGYAEREGLTYSFSYSLLIRTSDLAGRQSPLFSPPTLDWIQVIVLVGVVANIYFLAEFLDGRKKAKAEGPAPRASPSA